ncbi:hypothetical protein AWC38_SpisGene8725 [Stylophora pistillata]|uniref:Uncharacterized protein n=1 Tax=Stylophora pistillata TaxID=50429 RepID=A0A2B4SDJ9_STYPI|nr:hypothetical protein AWC38_SpisGene8725 [Stylophora pistillata]
MILTSCKKLTKDNVYFEDAEENQYGHQRIKILGIDGDNKLGPLAVATPFGFSFGVQATYTKDADKLTLTGYRVPMPLWNPENGGPTQKQLDFYTGLKELKHLCYEHLNEVYGIDVAESMRFPLLEIEGKAPVLHSKLLYSERYKKIRTLFHTREKAKVKPLDYLDQYCQVKMVIIIDSIYLGDEYASVQLKINDVYVKPLPQNQSFFRVHRITNTTSMESISEKSAAAKKRASLLAKRRARREAKKIDDEVLEKVASSLPISESAVALVERRLKSLKETPVLVKDALAEKPVNMRRLKRAKIAAVGSRLLDLRVCGR